MRCTVFFIALCVAYAALCPDVHANARDMQLRVVSGHEIGIVRHPAQTPEPAAWPKVYLPRFGVNYLYGVSRGLNIGAGLELSLARTLATHATGYQGLSPVDVTATYHDILMPLILETRLSDGSAWAWLAELSTGLAISHWHDKTVRPVGAANDLPFVRGDLWRYAWFGRVSLAREWRPNNAFGLRIGALAGVKSQGDLHFGLFASGDWLWLDDEDA